MNEFDMIVAVVAMIMVTVMLTARWKYKYGGHGGRQDNALPAPDPQLQHEVIQLRERVKVLERIAVEKEDSLTQQIEQLRDR
ncbi:hypothetical protein [Sphingomicrobium flavum]|uniref:hypothetical protein n=1 Tax=Sphingomicrobium flavum TaxID=1229164 RepID=UPI0021ADA2FB|nr:hypothetical protein [Sphingomicrobium flavum]